MSHYLPQQFSQPNYCHLPPDKYFSPCYKYCPPQYKKRRSGNRTRAGKSRFYSWRVSLFFTFPCKRAYGLDRFACLSKHGFTVPEHYEYRLLHLNCGGIQYRAGTGTLPGSKMQHHCPGSYFLSHELSAEARIRPELPGNRR